MSDNLTSLSNLFRASPLVGSGRDESDAGVPISPHATTPARADSCEGTRATTPSLDSDSDNELPSAVTSMKVMMSDNFTALSNFMTIGPSLFSDSSTKSGTEVTPLFVESSQKSNGSSNSNQLQLAGPAADVNEVNRGAENSAENDGSTSYSLSLPFLDAGKLVLPPLSDWYMYALSLLLLTNPFLLLLLLLLHRHQQ